MLGLIDRPHPSPADDVENGELADAKAPRGSILNLFNLERRQEPRLQKPLRQREWRGLLNNLSDKLGR